MQGVLHDGELKGLDNVTYRVGHKEFGREELTAYEKGEEDVGGDSQIGVMRVITVRRGQRKSGISRCLSVSPELMPRPRNWICCLLRLESLKSCSHTLQSHLWLFGPCITDLWDNFATAEHKYCMGS